MNYAFLIWYSPGFDDGWRVQSGAEAAAGGGGGSAGEAGDHSPQPCAAPAAAGGQRAKGDKSQELWWVVFISYQDVPKLRRTDVKYILHLLLRVVKSGKHPAEQGHQNNSSSSNNRQNNNPPNSVKIGFLGTYWVWIRFTHFSFFSFSFKRPQMFIGLRILLTCYRDSLSKEWLSIAATIRHFILFYCLFKYLFKYLFIYQEIRDRVRGVECGAVAAAGLHWPVQDPAIHHAAQVWYY